MKTGIALGGGGAKGFAHIGVLRALSGAGIDFDMVSGTSIGALIGAVYASGKLSLLEEMSVRYGMRHIPFLLGPTWPARGLFSGNYIERLLREIVETENIEDLKKPFAAVAVDLNKAEVVTFTEGNLCMAVHASMSIPGLFKPIACGDKLLVDGGVLEPVPVRALRGLGAEVVVAVDLLTNLSVYSPEPLSTGGHSFVDFLRYVAERFYMEDLLDPRMNEREYRLSLVDIVQRSSIAAQRRLTEYSFRDYTPDLIIAPPLSGVKVLDFHRGRSIMEIGRETGESMVPELMKLLGKN